jgi:hypothetical protein
MKPDDPPPGAPASPEAPPPASLTNVRLRGRGQAEPATKRGDLTQQLQAEVPAAPPPEPPRTPPKRGDLTQQLEAAATRKTAPPAVAPPPAPPPKAKAEPPPERKPAKAEMAAPQPKIEAPFERKPARAEAPAPQPKADPPVERKPAKAEAPAPQPKSDPPAERRAVKAEPVPAPQAQVERPVEARIATPPKAESPRERNAATMKAEASKAPPPALEAPPERRPAATKAEDASLGQDEVDALFDDVAPPPPPPPAVERKPVAAKSKPAAEPVEIEAETAAKPAADDPHASIPTGSTLREDDVRALLDPPGRRAAAAAPPAAETAAETESPEAEPEDRAAAQPSPPVAESEEAAIAEGEPPTHETPDLHLIVDMPESAAGATPAADMEPAAAGSTIDAIIDYWDGLRGEKPYPMLDTVDRSHVSASWPNCLLVAFTSMTSAEAAQPRMTRIGEANGDVEYTAMVIDWIIKCGRQSVKRGEPMEEEKRFPVSGGNARYQLLLLPLSSTEDTPDYVLAHLCKVKELSAGAAFKRWLAS